MEIGNWNWKLESLQVTSNNRVAAVGPKHGAGQIGRLESRIGIEAAE